MRVTRRGPSNGKTAWQPGQVNRVRQDGELCRIDKHGACVRKQGRYGRDQFNGASEIEVSAEVQALLTRRRRINATSSGRRQHTW